MWNAAIASWQPRPAAHRASFAERAVITRASASVDVAAPIATHDYFPPPPARGPSVAATTMPAACWPLLISAALLEVALLKVSASPRRVLLFRTTPIGSCGSVPTGCRGAFLLGAWPEVVVVARLTGSRSPRSLPMPTSCRRIAYHWFAGCAHVVFGLVECRPWSAGFGRRSCFRLQRSPR